MVHRHFLQQCKTVRQIRLTVISWHYRIKQVMTSPVFRTSLAFWLFGLINNVLYVVILTAAVDLVNTLPKAIVLLADIMPSFAVKLLAPFVIHLIPYRLRILVFTCLSITGMQIIAWSGGIPMRLLGIILASASAGGGELSFLQLTHFYGPRSLPFFSSGTGAAGLVGAGLFSFMTVFIGLSVRRSLLLLSVSRI